MDVLDYNRAAWDRQVEKGNEWTVPATPEAVANARRGEWHIVLTPTRPVPAAWFPPLAGADVLCLASGGGQQGPILAAAGANVTVFDNSPCQLGQDRLVAEREGLALTTIQGDMADLSDLGDECFDMIVHPVSNCFSAVIRPVWREAYRVLRPGGALLAGFNNPALYLFDQDLAEREGIFQVRYRLPYSDFESLTPEQRQRHEDEGSPLEFSHSLEDQIGGQIDAGFLIAGFYEDTYPDTEGEQLAGYFPLFIATRAVKLGRQA